MGILYDSVKKLNKENLRNMRVDIRLGLSDKELCTKYKLSIHSVKHFRISYEKALKKQREMGI